MRINELENQSVVIEGLILFPMLMHHQLIYTGEYSLLFPHLSASMSCRMHQSLHLPPYSCIENYRLEDAHPMRLHLQNQSRRSC